MDAADADLGFRDLGAVGLDGGLGEAIDGVGEPKPEAGGRKGDGDGGEEEAKGPHGALRKTGGGWIVARPKREEKGLWMDGKAETRENGRMGKGGAMGKSKRAEAELRQAAEQGNIKLVRELLMKGADPNDADHNGWTPLMHAAWEGSEDCVRALIEGGAEIGASDFAEQTSLMLAASQGEEGCVRALIEAGADLEAVDEEGASALHCAAEDGKDGCVRALIEAGANLKARDKDGKSPVDRAIRSGFSETAALVRSHAERKILEEGGRELGASGKRLRL